MAVNRTVIPPGAASIPPLTPSLLAGTSDEISDAARCEVLLGVAHLAPAEDPENTARILKEHFCG